MHDFDALSNADVSECRKEGKYGRKCCLAVDYEERNVVDFQAICEVADAFAVTIGMGDDDDFVTAVYELARKLVYMRFDASRLREEEIANHGDIVCSARHGCGGTGERRFSRVVLMITYDIKTPIAGNGLQDAFY